MTTLEEISTNPEANYEFWTERARLCLACWRSVGCKLEKEWNGIILKLKDEHTATPEAQAAPEDE